MPRQNNPSDIMKIIKRRPHEHDLMNHEVGDAIKTTS
jgi:hypothetical protein